VSNQPRKHHFIPQFYLAGFSASGQADGDLYVLDQRQRKRWKSTPKGTAHKRDFHTTDFGPNEDPMVIEKKLADFEGRWANVVRLVIENRSLPEDQLFADLMFFVAFMAVRVPRIRATLSQFFDGVVKSLIHATLSTPGGMASFRRSIEEQTGRKLTDQEFNQYRTFGLSQQYDADFDQTWHVQEMLQMGVYLAPLLSRRKWWLWTVKDDAPDLICSDSPVAPTWLVPVEGPLSPAFGTPNTVVSIPLNRRIALVSMLEMDLGPNDLDRDGVAVVNSMTGLYANQWYSASDDFVWLTKEHRVGNAMYLLETLEHQQERPD
jgi:hypothetical protein